MNIVPSPVPWIEVAIAISLVGALCVSGIRDARRTWRTGLAFSFAAFAATLLACVGFYLCRAHELDWQWSFESEWLGRAILGVDELNAPLLPLAGLLHFLTALATGRTQMRRFSMSWPLASEAIRIATLACIGPIALIALLALDTLPGLVELSNRRKPRGVYLVHMTIFVAFLFLGQSFVDPGADYRTQSPWATVPLLIAVLIRCGTVPAHCWLTDWFEHASFGNALLFVTPLTGVYAAVRLVLPIVPDWALQAVGIASLVTAMYAAGMAVVQRESRRFFAYLFLSHAALVLVGLELHTPTSLAGAFGLWISVALSLAGLGLTLRALEARFGRLSLAGFHGLYEHSPALAVCFALTGLASVGFPGTLGFIATELLVDGVVEADPYVGVGVILATAINGIAILRAYFILFTGTRRATTISVNITPRERIAVLTLAALILGGGLIPQPGIASRHRAAVEVLGQRAKEAPAVSSERRRSPITSASPSQNLPRGRR